MKGRLNHARIPTKPHLALSGRGRKKKEPGIHCLHVCLISQKSWKPGIIVLDLRNHDIIILNDTLSAHFPTNNASPFIPSFSFVKCVC